jgi:photosystem II stability/assembly factor-like uncharacterized protein
MATRTKRRPTPQKAPKRRKAEPKVRPFRWVTWPALIAIAAAGAFMLARGQAEAPERPVTPPERGLPETSDYHAVFVDPADPKHLLLGTHAGVYESVDGGRSWEFAALEGQDAMHLVRTEGRVIWAAGHEVLAKSSDGGETWTDVRPDGLPGLDIHGFAVHPERPAVVYAAVAGEGLYRSDNGAESFELVSNEVGPDVMAIALTPDGRIFAGDGGDGILASEDEGKTWKRVSSAQAIALSVSPADPTRLLAAGAGIFLTTDGGETWNDVHAVDKGVAAVAFAPGDPTLAYAVGFDRKLYRSDDAGGSWKPVA